MARVVLPGYPHHVTQRGNRRQKVFFQHQDWITYLERVSTACGDVSTSILAYCLMPNHVHLILVPTNEDGLRAAMADAHRRYTRRVNFREGWRGHLWQDRFHSFVMDGPHLQAAIPYVEENPVRAGLCEQPAHWAVVERRRSRGVRARVPGGLGSAWQIARRGARRGARRLW